MSSVTAITNLLWTIKDQPSTGNGEAAMGKVFMKNGRPARDTKLVKDKARVRAQKRTEKCDLRDNNRMEEDERVVEVQGGDDERARTRPPSLAIEDSTWVDNVGNIELQSLKEKGIMDAKKKAVLKMLDLPMVLPPRVEVAVDEIELSDTNATHMELEEANDVLSWHEAGLDREIGNQGIKAPVQHAVFDKENKEWTDPKGKGLCEKVIEFKEWEKQKEPKSEEAKTPVRSWSKHKKPITKVAKALVRYRGLRAKRITKIG